MCYIVHARKPEFAHLPPCCCLVCVISMNSESKAINPYPPPTRRLKKKGKENRYHLSQLQYLTGRAEVGLFDVVLKIKRFVPPKRNPIE